MTSKEVQGRRILNDNIRRDFARALQLAVEPDDKVDYSELEALASKYRMYYDEEGTLKEAD